jgi:hypothetical protein
MQNLRSWFATATKPPQAATNLHKALGCEKQMTFSIESGGAFWFTLVLPSTNEWTLRFYRCVGRDASIFQHLCNNGKWHIMMHNTLTQETIEPSVETTLLEQLIWDGYGCGASARHDSICWHCYDQVDGSDAAKLRPLHAWCPYCAASLCSPRCQNIHLGKYHSTGNKQYRLHCDQSSSSSPTSSNDDYLESSDEYHFSDEYISGLD